MRAFLVVVALTCSSACAKSEPIDSSDAGDRKRDDEQGAAGSRADDGDRDGQERESDSDAPPASRSGGVACGEETCTGPSVFGLVRPCCADEATAACGISVSGGPCSESKDPDPRCPSADVMGLLTLASCCTDAGECGLDGSALEAGCVELGEADAAFREAGYPVKFPSPQACD
ncbi:MAG: hypothetical protein OXU20_31930 [Myxococcales bacterium]|nr:hypothetical protein [Myxococcales bacterium]MDD9968390.1 hypothetical protein [Myxococcales bacterium]